MIKNIAVCVCDICGGQKEADTLVTPYGDKEYLPPKGWCATAARPDVHFCPKCYDVLRKRVTEHD